MKRTDSAKGVARVGSRGGATSTGGGASQVPDPSQTRPEPHPVPAATQTWLKLPFAGLQYPAVQGLPSSTMMIGLPRHVPFPWQTSPRVQLSPSLQKVPGTGVCETPVLGAQASAVHTLPSSIGTAGWVTVPVAGS